MQRRVRRAGRSAAATVSVVLGLLAGCSPTAEAPPTLGPTEPTGELPWLVATRGDRPGIFDEHGRQVVLRGANVNQLGDYFSSDPRLPTVSTLDDSDWSDLAAQGANVVRLVTTWSAWQPTRGSFDTAYLARVRAAIDGAAAHGIAVVIDMHQDAWSKFVFTPAAATCPAGTRHQIGWDGAPAWATFTDGAPTCTPAGREESPAVVAAWDNFYADRDGIRTELAKLWGRIAAEFATDPRVAGYDLLNEPGTASTVDRTVNGITAFYRTAISQIRRAERAVPGSHPRGHIIFFESSVHGVWPAFDLSDDTNLVFAPHNYAESIGPSFPGLMSLLFAGLRALAAVYRTPIWIGEYGFWGDTVERAERFAALEDEGLGNGGAGSTWWQWEQECGDPHDVNGAYPPSEEWIQRQLPTCGRDGGSLHCTDRPYPRAVPGRLDRVRAECVGRLEVAGRTTVAADADLWFPGPHDRAPTVSGAGISASTATAVEGGWRVTARVDGAYRIVVAA